MSKKRRLSEMGRAALRYAEELGWPVIPLDGNTDFDWKVKVVLNIVTTVIADVPDF